MKTAIISVTLCSLCILELATAAPSPSFKLLTKVKKTEAIKYKLLPHLGFAKYNAIRYEPLREAPAVDPVPLSAPYPPADPLPLPAPYPPAEVGPYAAPVPDPVPAPVPVGPYPPAL